MECAVVGVVVAIALIALVVTRRRAIEGETHARETAAGTSAVPGDGPDDDSTGSGE